MTDGAAAAVCCSCCCCCVVIPLTLGLLIYFSLHPTRSVMNIENIYIPALDIASNDSKTINTTTVSFRLISYNFSPRELYLDAVNITYYYGNNDSVIGFQSIPAFDIGEKGGSIIRDEMIRTSGISWEEARMVVSNGSLAMFRVRLDTKFRASNSYFCEWLNHWSCFPPTKRIGVKLGAKLNVNDHGKTPKNVVKLSSKPANFIMQSSIAATVHVMDCVRTSLLAALVLFLPILL
ncbi:protein NDR1-like [Papaver somniferum]|uniref:protein NDR1-like n=1 Tax=Papaver somniferum TaxID=3469 RepID=UPI000E701826|nr:protein NDR1-like [Papaver somniferum]